MTTQRPLSDLVPLRDTSVWPGYDTIAIIPRVYGRARVSPLRYNETNTRFVLADHAIAGVDGLYLDGQPHAGWRWRNGADLTGHAVAFLELAAPPDSGAILAADIRGLDGNPAAIVNDLYPRSDLQDFGIVCRNAGLELGGALIERQTIRAALQFILLQSGAMWSAGLSGFAALFPPSVSGPLWASLGPLEMLDWAADCALEDLVTRLTVPFDWDYARNQAQQSLVLEARASIQAYGVRENDLALPWVKTARQALATATAYLQWRARPLWTVQLGASVRHRSIPPGGWIALDHPRLPYSGWYVVTDIDPGYGRGGVTLTAQAAAGLVPTITLVQSSTAF